MVYLKTHNKWLRMDWVELYELAKRVADYRGRPRDILRELKNLFRKLIIEYREGVIEQLMVSWDKWLETR